MTSAWSASSFSESASLAPTANRPRTPTIHANRFMDASRHAEAYTARTESGVRVGLPDHEPRASGNVLEGLRRAVRPADLESVDLRGAVQAEREGFLGGGEVGRSAG